MKILYQKIIVLSVREYYLFRELIKSSFTYFGYYADRIVIAANAQLLHALGY